MAITATTKEEAWSIALAFIPGCCKKNVDKSESAGYAIYEDAEGNTICDLNCRFEVNFADSGLSKNIWIASESPNIKSREEIEKRITAIEQQIEWHKEDQTKISAEIAANIAKYQDDPSYIARWIESWMRPIATCEENINECYKRLSALAWVLGK